MPGGITYDSQSLQTSKIITSTIEHHAAPNKKISKASVAYGNKRVITNTNEPDKDVTITGMLVGDSIIDMDNLEDTFKGIIDGEEKNIDIEHGSSTRRYIGTPDAVRITRDEGLHWAEFSVRFNCQPYATDITATQLDLTAGYTSASRVIPMALVGNAANQYPIIKITIQAGTQLTNATIQIGNNANGQVLNITRTWVIGDILEINTFTSEIKVNGTEVIFSGGIPVFGKGNQNLTYADTFLTRTLDFDIKHYGLWK